MSYLSTAFVTVLGLLLVSSAARAESWHVAYHRSDMVRTHEVEVSHDGRISIGNRHSETKHCEESISDEKKRALEAQIQVMHREYPESNPGAFKPNCSDNPYFHIETSYGPEFRELHYWAPPLCIGREHGVASIDELIGTLEELYAQYHACGVQ